MMSQIVSSIYASQCVAMLGCAMENNPLEKL